MSIEKVQNDVAFRQLRMGLFFYLLVFFRSFSRPKNLRQQLIFSQTRHHIPVIHVSDEIPFKSLPEISKLYYRCIVCVFMDFLIDGKISSFFPDQHGGKLLTLIILYKLTQSLQNFKIIPFQACQRLEHGQFLHCQCLRSKLSKFRILPYSEMVVGGQNL